MISFIKIIAFFFLFVSFNAVCTSQAYCHFDQDVKSIYGQILNLNLESAKNAIGNKAETSLNKAYVLLENEIDFFTLFIYDQNEEYQKRKSQKKKRIESLENSDLSLEWKQFLEAEILLQWSLIYLKQGNDILAFQSIRESVQLLEENAKQFPNFIYSYKSLGILHSLLSTIPQNFRWAASILGLQGNLQAGNIELSKYIQFAEPVQDLFLDESIAAMSFIISYLENKPEDAFQYWIKKMTLKEPSALHVMVQCKLAIKSGYNDAAIMALESLDNSEKNKLPYLYFLMGLTKLQKLDVKSEEFFLKFLQHYQGSAYVKEAYQKLAWNSLLNGDKTMYHLYLSHCLTKGNALTDEDKQANGAALSTIIPDLLLLKARLLFDGGYAKQAFELLYPKKDDYYANVDKKLECAYRLGRICQMNKEPDLAFQFYKDALSFDPKLNSYMSCNALLQSGVILESKNRKEESSSYYQKVLETNPDEYKRSIHQKAKAGLARLKTTKNEY